MVSKRRYKRGNTAKYLKLITNIFAVNTCVYYSRRLAEKPHFRGFFAFPQIMVFLELAKWEEKLKLVECGELTADAFLSEIVGMTSALVKTYE